MNLEEMTVKVKTEGIEEATEKIENLADAYSGFPPQVTIKFCHDCKINIYPSQTKIVSTGDDSDD